MWSEKENARRIIQEKSEFRRFLALRTFAGDAALVDQNILHANFFFCVSAVNSRASFTFFFGHSCGYRCFGIDRCLGKFNAKLGRVHTYIHHTCKHT